MLLIIYIHKMCFSSTKVGLLECWRKKQNKRKNRSKGWKKSKRSQGSETEGEGGEDVKREKGFIYMRLRSWSGSRHDDHALASEHTRGEEAMGGAGAAGECAQRANPCRAPTHFPHAASRC